MYGIDVPQSQRAPALGIQAAGISNSNTPTFTVLAEDITVSQPKQLQAAAANTTERAVEKEDGDGVDIRVARRGDVLCAVNEVDVRALGLRATNFLIRSNEQSNLGLTLFFCEPSMVFNVHVTSTLVLSNHSLITKNNSPRTTSNGMSVTTNSNSSSTWSRLFTRLSGVNLQQTNEAIETNSEKGQIVAKGTNGELNHSDFENELFRLRKMGERRETDISVALFGANADVSECTKAVAQTLALLCLQFLEVSNAKDVYFTALPTLDPNYSTLLSLLTICCSESVITCVRVPTSGCFSLSRLWARHSVHHQRLAAEVFIGCLQIHFGFDGATEQTFVIPEEAHNLLLQMADDTGSSNNNTNSAQIRANSHQLIIKLIYDLRSDHPDDIATKNKNATTTINQPVRRSESILAFMTQLVAFARRLLLNNTIHWDSNLNLAANDSNLAPKVEKINDDSTMPDIFVDLCCALARFLMISPDPRVLFLLCQSDPAVIERESNGGSNSNTQKQQHNHRGSQLIDVPDHTRSRSAAVATRDVLGGKGNISSGNQLSNALTHTFSFKNRSSGGDLGSILNNRTKQDNEDTDDDGDGDNYTTGSHEIGSIKNQQQQRIEKEPVSKGPVLKEPAKPHETSGVKPIDEKYVDVDGETGGVAVDDTLVLETAMCLMRFLETKFVMRMVKLPESSGVGQLGKDGGCEDVYTTCDTGGLEDVNSAGDTGDLQDVATLVNETDISVMLNDDKQTAVDCYGLTKSSPIPSNESSGIDSSESVKQQIRDRRPIEFFRSSANSPSSNTHTMHASTSTFTSKHRHKRTTPMMQTGVFCVRLLAAVQRRYRFAKGSDAEGLVEASNQAVVEMEDFESILCAVLDGSDRPRHKTHGTQGECEALTSETRGSVIEMQLEEVMELVAGAVPSLLFNHLGDSLVPHLHFRSFVLACNTLPDTVESCFQLRQLCRGLGSARRRTLFILARLIRVCIHWHSSSSSPSSSSPLTTYVLLPSTRDANDAEWFAHRFSSVLLRPSVELSVAAVHTMKVCSPAIRALFLRLVDWGDYILDTSSPSSPSILSVVPRLTELLCSHRFDLSVPPSCTMVSRVGSERKVDDILIDKQEEEFGAEEEEDDDDEGQQQQQQQQQLLKERQVLPSFSKSLLLSFANVHQSIGERVQVGMNG